MIYILASAVVLSFAIMLYLISKQNKENPTVRKPRKDFQDTFGGPVDWNKH